MRWSCPHCGVNLAVSDDKLGNGWSFSRCYKCGGFALIRRAEVNLVKVDRAPAGEHIILPEATEEPDQMLSQDATENLARYRKESAEKAALRQAARVLQQQQQSAQASAEAAQSLAGAINSGNLSATPAATPAGGSLPPAFRPSSSNLPPPMAPLGPSASSQGPSLRSRARVLPVAIGVAAISAVGSGIYLFEQGQTLWEKARSNAATEGSETGSIRPASIRKTRAGSASGSASMADQVHQNAMAPLRGREGTDSSSGGEETPPLPAEATAQIQGGDVSGSLSSTLEQTSAMNASAQHSNRTKIASTGNGVLVVKLKGSGGKLYAGPGSLYPVVGTAEPARRYTVTDWNDRWFRVIVEDAPGKAPVTAWIRTDLVHVVPANGTERLPAYP